jgi:O-antigen/teichoic acid export membrane protein
MSYSVDTIRTIIVRFIVLILNIAGGIINARTLGPEGLGIFSLLVLVQAVSFRFGNLGFGSGISFFMARRKAPFIELIRFSWISSLSISCFCTVLLILFWKCKYLPWHDIPPLFFYLCLFLIPLTFIRNFTGRLLMGRLMVRIVNFSELANRICYFMLLVLLVMVFHLGLMGTLIAFLLSEVIANLYLVYGLRKTKSDGEMWVTSKSMEWLNLSKNMWKYARWNYLVLLLSFLLESLPTFILKYFFGNTVVGLFAVSSTIVQRTFVVTNSFAEVLFPYTAASDDKTSVRRTNMLCRSFTLWTIMVALILGIFSRQIIVLIFGCNFQASTAPFLALLPTLITYPLFNFLNTHISARGKSRESFLIMLPGLATGIISALLFIPPYAATGAGIAVSSTYSVLFVISLGWYSAHTGSRVRDLLVFGRSDWVYVKNLFGPRIRQTLSRRENAENGTSATVKGRI